ncbi:hypothetical protein CCO02nite_23610 [Cellulomonas composti]|uniref:Cobalt transporter n=1 Tax=Cellulomonas composti TaxID=266130 RepID=A0A511JDB2_9CELL|nr:hypothetical protein CCO02nite_23610 [Cellulomonas composti]
MVALDRLTPEQPVAARCTATVDGSSWPMSPDQAQHAALFAGTAARRDLPARAVTIAIATALQESRLENIDYGDRDSIGLFQQRPSQGWGTVEQIMDPVFSTGAFFDALVKVDGYQDMPITEAAQAVQRSGFPDAYAQHEGSARAWASALTGHSPGALTCTLPERGHDGAPVGSPVGLAERVARDLGDVRVEQYQGGDDTPSGVTVHAEDLGPDPQRQALAVAAWAVAVAYEQGITRVQVGDTWWDRDTGEWSTGPALDPGLVDIQV